MNPTEAKRLKSKIETIQGLMVAFVTDGRATNQPAEYFDCYSDLDIALEDAGYENPNPHKSLEAFWGFCKLHYGKYAERRAYVQELYASILLDLDRKIKKAKDPKHWERANEELQDGLGPVRAQWLKAKNFIYSSPPDYENSIKESINSVESTLKILLDQPKLTLGKLIKQIEIDPDIEKLISQSYGLLSNKESVRHGGISNLTLSALDAEFFLEFAAISIIYLKKKHKEEKIKV